MTELFHAVLKASFQGSIVILAVLFLRLLLKKAPKSLFCLLWLLAGLRLVLPFEIESKLSLQPQLQEPEVSIQMETPVQMPDFVVPEVEVDVPEAPSAPVNPGNYENTQNESFPYEVKDGVVSPITFGGIAAQIWLLGMGIMVLASLWSYWRLKRRVRMAYLIENGCFECPGLDTAFVLGFLPPKVYLPAGLTDNEKEFIYDHENTHIARGDHWFKLLGWLVLSLHWFNPLVWVGYGLLCRDIELACDEHVVRNMSLAQRKAYSAALLSCGGHTARIAACPVAFGESNPRRRIMNVLNYKRPGFWISLAAVIAVIFVAVCLLTSPGKPSLLEFGNVADEELHVICIGTENGLTDVSHPDDIREIQKLLDSISWEEDTPTERGDESDGYVILFNSLLAEDALYFSEDCSLVWAEGTQAYPVSDARKLREYLDNLSEAVWNRETAGEPFADINQPAQWLRGISESAVREAQIYVEQPTVQEGNTSTTSCTQGVLSERDFEALLDILNGLPENAIVSESTLSRGTFGWFQQGLEPHGGMTLTIYDDVNQLVMLLRLVKNDVVEIILIDELDKVEGNPAYLDHPRCWIIEDDTLLAFLKEMQEDPLVIYPIEFFGHDTPDAEETLPAWNMEMTNEEFLAMCRDAAEKFQEQEHYHISETLVYYINEKEDARDYCTYWRAGDNWLRDSQAAKLRENTDVLYYEGNLYLRRNAEAGWTKVDGGAGYNRVWLEILDWDAQEINFTFAEQVEDVLHVFVTVNAAPPTIGWDDVGEYMLGFFFDTDGNLLSAMMGCTREEINVMSDLRMNSTTAQSIRTKLEQEGEQCHGDSATCTEPDCTNPAHQHDLDKLEAEYEAKLLLAKCAAALEEYQSQGTWAIQTEISAWGVGVLNSSSLSQWFGNGEDYYTWTRIDEDKGAALWFDLCVDGEAYHRKVYSVTDGTTEDWNTQWEEGSTDNQVIYPHWPLWYDWVGADIQFVEQVTTDSMESVTFTVQGCPFPEHPDRIDEYQVTFHFQEDVLFWIQLTYQRADALGGGKREYKLSAFTPADAENISKCHSEALLDIHGICNDPACTDESHDHSGINCTDADCTNSAHHHDEDHH